MYVLYAENKAALAEKTRLFEQYMEPILAKLDSSYQQGHVPADFTEIPQYLQVCRWPFRKLEYSFVLDALLDRLTPNSRYLDAGSGVTPLVHVFASREVQAEASDGDEKLIGNLNRLDTQRIYGTAVQYTTQNLTKTSYPDAIFDAISCVSVLEHISAPYDQMAIQELVRILKPGGILVLTVDFTPPAGKTNGRSWGYYWQRTTNLARTGNLGEIGRGIRRKLEARKAVQEGAAQHARSVNQCFEVVHLEDDILPLLQGEALESHIPFLTDLHALSPDDARRFWNMEVNLFDAQGRRDVLPAAYIFRKLKD